MRLITPEGKGICRVGDPEAEAAVPQGGARPRAAAAADHRALANKTDHSVPEDFFLDMLDEQFSDEECAGQLETAINWGRYAELFDWDDARRRFILHVHEHEEPADGPGSATEGPKEQEKAG